MKKINMTIQKKTGIVSTAATVIVVIAIIAVNIFSSYITEKYPVKIDLTQNQAFKLTQESIDYLNKLDKKINITVMNSKKNFLQGGAYFEQALNVIEQYEKYGSDISVEYVDLIANPTLANKYGDLQVSINDIVINSGENTQKLTPEDLFNVESSWYGGTIASSNAEQAMTGAIMNITTGVKPVVTLLQGHDEGDSSALSSALTKNGYDVNYITPITEEIPKNTSVLVAVSPKRDYSPEVIKKLDDFMNSSEDKSMLYFAFNEESETPNMDAWLAKRGISIENGMVAETSQNRVINNNGFFGIVDIDDYSVAEKMKSRDVPMAVPFSKPIKLLFEEQDGFRTQSLFSYSASAGIVDESVNSVSEIKPSGPITVAAKSVCVNEKNAVSTLYTIGTPLLLDGNFFGNSSLANMDYFLSLFAVATQKADTFMVAPKVLGGGTFSMVQSKILMFAFILVIAIPVLTLGTGIYVWRKRRKR
ncbi:MAG: GldG family protein [Oscillospiraceae bacterium]